MKHAPKGRFNFSNFKPRDPRDRVRERTVEDDWLAFEEERGPAECMDEEDLKPYSQDNRV